MSLESTISARISFVFILHCQSWVRVSVNPKPKVYLLHLPFTLRVQSWVQHAFKDQYVCICATKTMTMHDALEINIHQIFNRDYKYFMHPLYLCLAQRLI